MISVKTIIIISVIIISVIIILMLLSFSIDSTKTVKKLDDTLYIGEALHNIGKIYQKLCINIINLNFTDIYTYCTESFINSIKNKTFINVKYPLNIVNVKFIKKENNYILTEIIAFTALGEYLKNTVKVIYNKDIILIDEVV